MLKYIKTKLDAKAVQENLQLELSYCADSLVINNKQKSYLKTTYNFTKKDVSDRLAKYVRCTRMTPDLIQVYFIDKRMNDIIMFLNEGNLEIKGNNCVSNLVELCIARLVERGL